MFPSFTAIESSDLLANFHYQVAPMNIDQHHAHALMEQNGAIVIDVRTREEYDEGHIAGAYLVPLDEVYHHSELNLLKARNTPVLLYCRSGRRSGLVMHDLARLGFKYLMNMGGVLTWEYGLTTAEPTLPFAEAVARVTPLADKF